MPSPVYERALASTRRHDHSQNGKGLSASLRRVGRSRRLNGLLDATSLSSLSLRSAPVETLSPAPNAFGFFFSLSFSKAGKPNLFSKASWSSTTPSSRNQSPTIFKR